MVKWREVSDTDLNRLVEAIHYVISRKGQEIDSTLVAFLKEELVEVTGHIENEKTGNGHTTVSEIEAVIGFIQR